jgi:DNA primase
MMPSHAQRNDRGGGGNVRYGNFANTSRGAPSGSRGNFQSGKPGNSRFGVRDPRPLPSARLSGSPIVRGSRSTLLPREALMLLALINHPWLLDSHTEEFADLEFLNPEADQIRRAILDAGTDHHATTPEQLREAIAGRGLGPALTRVEAAITHSSDWPAKSGAAAEDVAPWWTHVVTLHRKKRSLNKELKDAERALGEEPTDANLTWLRDVQGRISALDGSEAQIDGFGSSSGRSSRSL